MHRPIVWARARPFIILICLYNGDIDTVYTYYNEQAAQITSKFKNFTVTIIAYTPETGNQTEIVFTEYFHLGKIIDGEGTACYT